MSSYKGQVIDFFDRRTAYDAEGDSHPREAKLLLESVLIRSGFKDILIESDRSGKYINSNYVAAWDGQDFYPRGNPLLNLSLEQRAQLQAEYQKEIAELVTEQGVWQDTTTLHVKSCK